MDFGLLCDMVDKLAKYSVNFYDNHQYFIFNDFKKDCIKQARYYLKMMSLLMELNINYVIF